MGKPGKIQSKIVVADLICKAPPEEIIRLLKSPDISQEIKELVAMKILAKFAK